MQNLKKYIPEYCNQIKTLSLIGVIITHLENY